MGQPKSYPPYIYDLIVVGGGTSAATYLSTVHQNRNNELPPLLILIIGKEDPWAGARGYKQGQYTQYLNQATQLLDRGEGADAPTSQEPTDRQAWAQSNSTIINSNNSDYLDAEVRLIEKLTLPPNIQGFKVSVIGSQDIYVCKQLVLATGAGIEPRTQSAASYSNSNYHEVPGFAAALRDGVSVMNLDEFQNGNGTSSQGSNKTLAVFGPNAGTDAIMEASLRNYSKEKVHWFIKNGSKPGTDLTFDISDKNPAWTVQQAAANKPGGLVARYDNDNSIRLSKHGGKIRIEYSNNNTSASIDVDYVVYAVGQRGGGIKHRATDTGELEYIVSNDIRGELEPIYDTNQRFASGPAQHVLGLQLKGTKQDYGMRIFGSGATQAARDVKAHNYLDAYIDELLSNIRRLTALFHLIIFSRDSEFSWLNIAKFNDIQVPLNDAILKTHGDAFLQAVGQELQNKLPGNSSVVQGTKDVCISAAKDLVYHQILRQKARRQHLERKDARVNAMLSAGFEKTKPATTADNRLVGGLISNINAAQETLPTARIKNKEGGVNFSEDRQIIALYIAQNYPNIDSNTANEFVDEVIQERVGKLRGFSEAEIDAKRLRLDYLEAYPKASTKKIVQRYVINH